MSCCAPLPPHIPTAPYGASSSVLLAPARTGPSYRRFQNAAWTRTSAVGAADAVVPVGTLSSRCLIDDVESWRFTAPLVFGSTDVAALVHEWEMGHRLARSAPLRAGAYASGRPSAVIRFKTLHARLDYERADHRR